jgi:hypothetical protein
MAKQPSTYDVYGRYVDTYTKTTPNAVLRFGNGDERAEAKRAGRLRTMVYVSRSLLSVAAAGDWLHAPECLRVSFTADESPAYPVEAERLTDDLYRTIASKVNALLESPAGDLATKQKVTHRFAELRRLAVAHGILGETD